MAHDIRTMTAGELAVTIRSPATLYAREAAIAELARRAGLWEQANEALFKDETDDVELYATGSGEACVRMGRAHYSAATLRAAVEAALQEPQP